MGKVRVFIFVQAHHSRKSLWRKSSTGPISEYSVEKRTLEWDFPRRKSLSPIATAREVALVAFNREASHSCSQQGNSHVDPHSSSDESTWGPRIFLGRKVSRPAVSACQLNYRARSDGYWI
jgi:hypothetical protein